jgi:glycosyltransferase involved in cell wall biosynthesis
MFSPLPPRANGIGDYCFELLGCLARDLAITVVVEDGTDAAVAPPGVRVLTEAQYDARDLRAFLHIYQIGNNPDHIYMLRHIARTPGLVVLHDPSLHYLLDCATVARGNMGSYLSALMSEYGAPGQILGAQFESYGLRDQSMFLDMPMTSAIIGTARGIIVHSHYAASQALAQAPAADVSIVPHHFSPPPGDSHPTPFEQRRLLGIEDGEVMLLSLGFVTRAKQLDRALRALAARQHDMPPYRYVIAGTVTPDEVDIAGLASELGLQANILLLGHVPESAFFALARAADIVINLRYPIGGETSGTMVRALGCGACVVVVDRGPFAEIPDGAAWKLAWGDCFQQELGDALVRLAREPQTRAQIGQSAASYITAHHSLEMTVSGYTRAIAAAQQTQAPHWANQTAWQVSASTCLQNERAAARLALGPGGRLPRWFLAGAIPHARSGHRPCRAVAFGAAASDLALLTLIGLRNVATPPWAELEIFPRRCLDLLVLFTDQPLNLLAQANALLSFGGRLVLVTSSSAISDDRQLPGKIAAALRRHGFYTDMSCLVTPPSLDPSDEDDGDRDGGASWSAVKFTEFGAKRGGETGESLAKCVSLAA